MGATIKKYLDILLASIVAFTAFNFYYLWVAAFQMDYLRAVVTFTEDRPYVYRVLVPFLARLLSTLSGIDAISCLMFVVVCSAIGLYFSFKYFYTTFYDPRHAPIISFIGCELYFLLIAIVAHVYDIATGAFFCLSLAFMARRKLKAYYLLFPLATLNRETTFLLILFFVIYFLGRIPFVRYGVAVAYQGIVYLLIKIATELAFIGHRGQSFIWWPDFVFREYGKDLVRTSYYVIIFSLFVGLVLYDWKKKPPFLRSAFLVLGPSVLVLHFLIGYPYEVRVFAEAFPAGYLLAAAIIFHKSLTTAQPVVMGPAIPVETAQNSPREFSIGKQSHGASTDPASTA